MLYTAVPYAVCYILYTALHDAAYSILYGVSTRRVFLNVLEISLSFIIHSFIIHMKV